MEEYQAERISSNILEFIKWTKCDQKTCFNFDHNCLIMLNQKHFILSANDFCKWDKAIEMSKATLYLPPLNIKDSPVESRKSQISITNNNTTLFNDDFPSSYPFPSSSYSFPSSFYPFVREYSMPGYSSYESSSSSVMSLVFATPIRQGIQLVFSFSNDSSSVVNELLRLLFS